MPKHPSGNPAQTEASPPPLPGQSITQPRRAVRLLGLIAAVIVVGGGAFLGLRQSMPVQLLSHYPLDLLAEEANTMVACAECHEGEELHSCNTCHDDHGAVEFADVPFYAVVNFNGDVPSPGFILLHEILPYQDQPHTHIPVLTFLANQGVTDFESVTMASKDGGFITVSQDQLSEASLLLPYADGIRFADENLHVSTWIKGITDFIVVGHDTPLSIEGEATSIGRLLLGPIRSVTVEETEVKLRNEETEEVRTAKTSSRLEGAAIEDLLSHWDFSSLEITTAEGQTVTLSEEIARGALLANQRGEVTLILPNRGRSDWVRGVVALRATP
jgi:hypothetical protein